MATTSTTLNDLLPSIVAEAMFVASERSIMRNLVKNYTMAPGNGKTITVPRYPIQTAASVSEGVDLTDGATGNNVNVSTDGAILTVSEVPFLFFDSLMVNILDKFFANISMLSFPCFPVNVLAFFVLTNNPLIIFL